jgi:hypothetical protein
VQQLQHALAHLQHGSHQAGGVGSQQAGGVGSQQVGRGAAGEAEGGGGGGGGSGANTAPANTAPAAASTLLPHAISCRDAVRL